METKIKKLRNIRRRNFYLYTKTNELWMIFLYYPQKKGIFFIPPFAIRFQKNYILSTSEKTLMEDPDENMPLIPDDPVFRSAAALCTGLFGLQKKDLRRISDQRKPSVLFAEMFQHNPAGM